MKTKHIHFKSGNMTFTFQANGLIRCELRWGYFDKEVIAKFFVPHDTTKKAPLDWPSKEVVDFRLKRDFNISVDHYSATLRSEK